MKRTLLNVVACLLIFQGYSQSRFAYLPGGKTTFQTSFKKIIFGIKENHTASSQVINRLNEIATDTCIAKSVGPHRWNIYSLKTVENNIDSINAILAVFRADTNIAYANPIMIYNNGRRQALTDQLIVRVKSSTDTTLLASLYGQIGVYSIKANPYTEREYFLAIHPTAQLDAMDAADSLYQSGLFDYSEPDFVILDAFQAIKATGAQRSASPDDPLYDDQWYINNTGQYNGTSGADDQAVPAWCTTTGSGIKVAVLDVGTDLTHPDLESNLLTGYDATGGGSAGGPSGDDAHGTATAGIIGAIANNSLGIAGIANTAKILPVRVATGTNLQYGTVATGVGWAASSTGGNADILSCSFYGGSPSSSLNTAIASAISSGRGGKGCVILFCSGNEGASSLPYPDTIANVVAVGGTDPCDQRFNFTSSTPSTSCQYDTRLSGIALSAASNYGTKLGVVSGGINIATLDIHGTTGYSDISGQGYELSGTDYILNFDGTSASCPQAAAVVALILSINPALTYSQAVNILESTADKVGGYSYSTYLSNGYWNNKMGYGRIDAAAAVNAAIATLTMTGPSYICSGSASYSMTVPSGITVTWSVSGSNATLSCTTCTTTSLTAVTEGQVTLTATLSNSCGAITGGTFSKYVNIKENPITTLGTPGTCSGTTQTWTLAATPA